MITRFLCNGAKVSSYMFHLANVIGDEQWC